MKRGALILVLIFVFTGCEITELPPREGGYSDGDSVLLYVDYKEYYACAVTAVAMLLEYQGLRFTDNQVVNEQHARYYAHPKDTETAMLRDSSVIPNPPQTCLADFLRTSWYIEECWYKATDYYNVVSGTRDFTKFVGSEDSLYAIAHRSYYDYVRAIDENRPVFLCTTDESSWHARLGVGYVLGDSAFLTHGRNGRIDKYTWNWTDKKKMRIYGLIDMKLWK